MAQDYMKRYRKAARAYLDEHDGRLIPEPRPEAGPFEWSDVWLMMALKSVDGSANGTALFNVMACGDALNHAGFTRSELRGGFNRLEAAGYISVEGSECALTAKFREAWAGSGAEGKSNSRQQTALRKILDVQE